MKVPKQPEVNIGTAGHVDHGKTTLTHALTGEWTDRHSEEVKRGISIKLGYADVAFYKCLKCPPPECYVTKPVCEKCGSETEFLRAVSFVDAPGHETLMATMLSGAALMDGAMLVIAANEKCPQPQTKEHLMALEITGVKNIIVVQNKIDVVNEEKVVENYNQIQEFLKGTIAEDAPIIPVSAHKNANIDVLVQAIQESIPTPERDPNKDFRMFVARSFDVNLPGAPPEKLKGGVLGGSLIQGSVKIGDEIEVLPGRKAESHGKVEWVPIRTTVTSLFSSETEQEIVGPGGLVAIGTKLDPSITKADSLIGSMAGKPGTLPEVMEKFSMDVSLLERVVGAAEELKVEKIKTRDLLMLSIGTATTVGMVSSARERTVDVILKRPVCAEVGQRVAISRQVSGRWRLIGYGIIG